MALSGTLVAPPLGLSAYLYWASTPMRSRERRCTFPRHNLAPDARTLLSRSCPSRTLNADTDSAHGPSPAHRGGLRTLFLYGVSIEGSHHALITGGFSHGQHGQLS